MKETDLLSLERKYIKLQYDPFTQGYLREFCQDHGFDLSIDAYGKHQNPNDFDFHTTLWYTESEHKMANGSFATNITVQATGFALFGEEQNVLVLELASEDLVQLRDELNVNGDMQEMWPEYRPHITVCYNWTAKLPDFDPAQVLTKSLVGNQYNIKTQKRF